MIVVTGAAGFIGSCLAGALNRLGHKDLVLVDDFSSRQKQMNLAGKVFRQKVHREAFFGWLGQHHAEVSFVFHLGARTNTAERSKAVFDHLNLNYSMELWKACTAYSLPLVYASSAATYGEGEHGYNDNHDHLPRLRPLNPYGHSKHSFDLRALSSQDSPPFWAGLKFFNVYGPNEYHKGNMASAVFHAWKQIREKGRVRLFRSHRPGIGHGEQQRDFVYVKDVVDVCTFLMQRQNPPAIYNLGTGRARSFLELAGSTFAALGIPPQISFVDTPLPIRGNYQYFTCADTAKLRRAGYNREFWTLEEGVADYVQHYLRGTNYY